MHRANTCGSKLLRLLIAALLAALTLSFFTPSSHPALAADYTWTIQMVDNSGNVGWNTSLAFDTSGNPAISYYDADNYDLKLARWNGTTWDVQTVDSTGDVGTYSSLAFDSSGNLAISYLDNSNGALKLARWNGTTWDVQTVDTTGRTNKYTDSGNSLAFDSSGNPAIGYNDYTNGALKLARWTGSTWNIQTVDSAGDVGYDTSLAFDSPGNPAISYRGAYGPLKFARWTGLTWDIRTVDSGGYAGYYSSLAFDSSGNPAISYMDGNLGDLKYARLTGSTWNIETVDSHGTTSYSGYYTSLAFDPQGNPTISYAYYDGSAYSLRLARKIGTTWNIQTVNNEGYYAGLYTSLAFDSAGNPAISYYDGSWTAVKYASVDSTPPPTPTLVSPASVYYTNSNYPYLDWSDVSDPSGVTYSLQVRREGTKSDFSSPEVEQTSLSSSNYTPWLVEFTHYWRVKAVDGAGNESAWTSAWSFTIDNTVPTVSLASSPSGTVTTNTPTFTGSASDTASPIASVSYQIDWSGTWLAAQAVDGAFDELSEDYSFTTAVLSEGIYHYMYVKASDAAGNESSSWASRSFIVDIQPPSISNLSPAADATTEQSQPNIRADFSDATSTIDTATYRLWVDSVEVTGDATWSSSSVSYTPLTPLSLGSHTIKLTVGDNVGNLATKEWSFTVINTPPQVTSLSAAQRAGTRIVDISFNVADSLQDEVTIKFQYWDGTQWKDSQTTSGTGLVATGWRTGTWDAGTDYSGNYKTGMKIKVTADDGQATNNLGSVQSAAFVLDTKAPSTPTLQQPGDGTYWNSTPQLNWSDVTDPSGISYGLQVDNNSNFSSTTKAVEQTSLGSSDYWLSWLAEGTYYWRVKAVDGAGNGSAWTTAWSFTIDYTPPTLSLASSPSGTVITNTPTFTGSASDTRSIISSVSYQVDWAGDWITAQATDGAFDELSEDFTLTTAALSEGYHHIEVKAKDKAGNDSYSATRDFTVDSQPPAVTNLSPAENSTTDQAQPNIKADFNDPAGMDTATFHLWVDSVEVTEDASWSSGSVSYTPLTPLSLGSHTVKLTVGDNVGNLATKEWSFTVINSAPQITSLTASQRGGTRTVDISFNVSDSQQAKVTLSFQYWDGTQWKDAPTTTGKGLVATGWKTATWDAGTDYSGKYTLAMKIKVTADDGQSSNNLGSVESTTFVLDTKAPTVPTLQYPDDNAFLNGSPQLNWSDVTDPSGLGYSLQVDNNSDFSSREVEQTSLGSSDYWLPWLAEGTYSWRVKAVDGAGNGSAWTTPRSFTIDTTAPTLNLTISPSGTISATTPTLTGSAVDARSAISSVSYQIDWSGTWVEAQATDGAFDGLSEDFSFTTATLNEGGHHLDLKAKDVAGNESSYLGRDFTVDSQPPSISNLSPAENSTTDQTQPNIKADFSDPAGIDTASFHLWVDGVEVTEEATWSSGSGSYTPPNPLSLGPHAVKLEVKDNAGNLATKEWSFTVTNAPPQVTNLNAAQRSGTRMVDIAYDINDTQQGTVTISFQYWDGTQWKDCQTTTGEGSVSTGGRRTGSWDAGADYSGNYKTGMKIKVTADDGQATSNLGSVESAAFILDTRAPSTPTLQQPVNGSTANNNSPYLNWSDVTDPSGVNYSLQVDNNSDFSSPEVNQTSQGNSDYFSPWLGEGTYNWRVRAADGAGNQSAWTSPTWSFTIDTTAPAVNLTSAPGSTTDDSTPTFTGSASDTKSPVVSVSYQIDWGSWESAPAEDGAFDELSENFSFTTATLSEGYHHIEIKAKDAGGQESISTVRDFVLSTTTTGDITPPPRPSLLSPAITSVTAPTPTLDWSDVSDPSGVSYILQIGADPTFSPSLLGKIGLANSQYTVAVEEALPSQQYYWRVKAIDGQNNESEWTDPLWFMVAAPSVNLGTVVTTSVNNAPPPVVSAKSQADTEVSFSPETGNVTGNILVAKYNGEPETSVPFTAGTSKNVLKFVDVYASFASATSPGMATVKVYYADSEVSGWVENSLLLYYWDGDSWETTQNSSVDTGSNLVKGDAPVSALRGTPFAAGGSISGADITAPVIPTLLAPDDGVSVSPTPVFYWKGVTDPSGVTYHLQVDNNPDFSSPQIDRAGILSSTYSLAAPAESLSPGTYYWRVMAIDGATPPNQSNWSSTRSIIAQPQGADITPPPIPGLQEPQDGAVVGPYPTLRWSQVSDPSGVTYILIIDDSPELSTPWLTKDLPGNLSSYTLAPGEGVPLGTYYWWAVKARDGQGNESGIAETRSFRIELESAQPPGGGGPVLLYGITGFAVLILAVAGISLSLMGRGRRRAAARELARYEEQIRQWEAEGYDVSRLRKKYFGKK